MLQVAQQMIAEKGIEAIKMRDLAEACRVSVPTLYNEFGGKERILGEAIEQHFQGETFNIEALDCAPGFDRLIRFLDELSQSLLWEPEFQKQFLRAFAKLELTLDIQQRMADTVIDILESELLTMQQKGVLVEWVNPRLLATHINSAFTAVAVMWAHDSVSDKQLGPTLKCATGLVLLGIVSGEARETLEGQIHEAQQCLSSGEEWKSQ